MKRREKLSSRLGFILLSAGCAIGLGNVWKFPYVAGQYGGGVFLILYFIMLIFFGIPIMTMEFAIGRAAQKAPVRMYDDLEPKGTKWHIHGYVGLFGCILLMMYYPVVAGWIVRYFIMYLCGSLEGVVPDTAGAEFEAMLASPFINIFYTAIVVAISFAVCAMGLQKGLERITKYLMAALLLIMVVLAINSFTLEGSREGLKFFLFPDIDRAREIGFTRVIMGALNQAFFTLSVGVGSMAVFGSYIGRERSLFGESMSVTLLDTFVAVTAGLIMFPACFSYGIDVNTGPALLFITMPGVFSNMSCGRLWGALFFLFMAFAAFTTAFGVFEGIIANFMELTGFTRKKICLICGIGMFILALPCALGFNVLSGITPFGEGTFILDLEDFIESNLILPTGALVYVCFCTAKIGWGWDSFIREANQGEGIKMPVWLKNYMKYFVPLLLILVIVFGIRDFLR
ncbi:MAG TPA: sodium-dependent transporter [Lachnospiraceae bacterium]|nr:sodium-dependent transporter [Lachnospiraceae bacterium]